MLMSYWDYSNLIYQEHIKKPLTMLGHNVIRVDDNSKSTNIFNDILDLFRKSDIIIDDLIKKIIMFSMS